jgi:hypothetical protein
MTFEARALTADQSEAVLADPETMIEQLFFDEDDDYDFNGDDDDEDEDDEEADDKTGGLLAADDDDEAIVDLDKAWHGVHFLLTGTAWDPSPPLGLAIQGGRPIGPELHYGPARFLDAGQVEVVATALAAVDLEQIRERFDPTQFESQEIYPTGIWSEEDILDEYLLPNLRLLTDFYSAAAAKGATVVQILA